jgi:hypothetical protein
MRPFVAVLLCLLLLPCLTLALSSSVNPNKKKFYGGAGIGRLVIDEKVGKEGFVLCHYDMVLCERIQGRAKSKSGLYIPDEDLPRLHLCRVLSMVRLVYTTDSSSF